MDKSYVTFATDDISCLGCLVLCNSLKQTGTEKLISVIVNSTVSYHLKSVLQNSFDRVYFVNELCVIIDGCDRVDVCGDYERLTCWLLSDFTKCVFLESDVLVVENIDDLFDRLELSAVIDPKWPDCFDEGVFVFEPCLKTYQKLIEYSILNPNSENSFQCLLNMFFSDWSLISMERRIPFTYNCQMNTAFYTHTAALVQFGHSIKAARLGDSTFHLTQSDHSISGPQHDNWSRLWSQWWKIFNEMVKPAVDNNNKFNFRRTGIDYNLESEDSKQESSSQSPGPICPATECPRQRQDSTCQSQEITCAGYGSASSIQESVCPSQDFADPCQPAATYIVPTLQNITQEEPRLSICDFDSEAIIDNSMSTEDMEKDHRLRWERGEIDYMGKDRFDNILAQLNTTLVSSSSDEEQVINPEE